ncbi:hypothetical protein [Empedobacter sp.]|uniref:hypothetical protein n=1 Tax=Empedobacter sp. TaxID=1927715 RepID=UPI0028A81199|nr:hypothetical protein [Empedobacter sp.]
MKKIILLITVFVAIVSCTNKEDQKIKELELKVKELEHQKQQDKLTEKTNKLQTNIEAVESLQFLKRFNGKHPEEIKLFQHPIVVKRLKNLLKDRYIFLREKWNNASAIEIKNDVFEAWACEQNNCGSTNFIIVIDFLKDVIYVGIREEGVERIYSEDDSSNIELVNWINGE